VKESTIGLSAMVGIILLICANIGALATAVVTDIVNDRVLWVLVDCIASPVGVIRGWLMWFGVV
jgi:hypothetical protein